MAYAKLAQLSVEFGLYSSFMGVLIYWFFATSKDITIGPVAVLSTVTGNVVLAAEKKLKGENIPKDIVASSLAIIAGAIVLFLGLIRLGWIVDLISLPAISAFMTGSALNIATGQVPAMMGIHWFFNARFDLQGSHPHSPAPWPDGHQRILWFDIFVPSIFYSLDLQLLCEKVSE